MEIPSEPVPAGDRLPYPHCFNDCMHCRETDADFEILEEPVQDSLKGRPARRLCRQCLGPVMVTMAAYSRSGASPGGPLTVTVSLLTPDRTPW